MKIMLNHNSPEPLYKQLAACLRNAIISGEYAVGVPLPTEEQLTQEAGIAKGTVKQAYGLLRKEGLLKTIRGSGSYVASRAENKPLGPEEILSRFFTAAYRRGTSAHKVYQLFFQQLNHFYAEDRAICAALLDCNWETLHVISRQLSQIPGLIIVPYKESELLFKYNMAIRSECSLLITTKLHHQAIIRYVGGLGLDIETIAIREKEQTIAALSRLPEGSNLCLVYRSEEFMKAVMYTLSSWGLRDVICVHEDNFEAIEEHVAAGTPFLVPPDYMEYTNSNTMQILERAKKAGLKVIPFEYEVEKGSLLHLQQKIQGRRKEG